MLTLTHSLAYIDGKQTFLSRLSPYLASPVLPCQLFLSLFFLSSFTLLPFYLFLFL